MPYEQMIAEYSGLFMQYIDSVKPEKLIESQLRGWLYKNNHNIRLPTINQLLSWSKMDFNDFVCLLSHRINKGVL
jgi:hypothetical protein